MLPKYKKRSYKKQPLREMIGTLRSKFLTHGLHISSMKTYSFFFIDMPGCCALTCKHGYKSQVTPKDVQWIPLPKDKSLRKAWLFRIHRENEEDFVSEHTVICSYHFKEEDWIPDNLNYDKRGRKYKKRRLKTNAIPSVNLRPPREQGI